MAIIGPPDPFYLPGFGFDAGGNDPLPPPPVPVPKPAVQGPTFMPPQRKAQGAGTGTGGMGDFWSKLTGAGIPDLLTMLGAGIMSGQPGAVGQALIGWQNQQYQRKRDEKEDERFEKRYELDKYRTDASIEGDREDRELRREGLADEKSYRASNLDMQGRRLDADIEDDRANREIRLQEAQALQKWREHQAEMSERQLGLDERYKMGSLEAERERIQAERKAVERADQRPQPDLYAGDGSLVQRRWNNGQYEFLQPDGTWTPQPPEGLVRGPDAMTGTLSKGFAKQVQGFNEAATAAEARLPKIQSTLATIKASPDLYLGPGADKVNTMKQLITSLGWGDRAAEVSDYAQLNQIATELALEYVQDTKGAISELEMKLFMNATASPNKTVAENIRLLEMAERINQRVIEKGDFFTEMVSPPSAGGQGLSFVEAQNLWRKYVKENPLFEGVAMTGGGSGSGQSIDDIAKMYLE